MPRDKYSRGKRNKIPIEERIYVPDRSLSQETKDLGLRMVAQIRAQMGWDVRQDSEED